jgi:hypothetical protein
MLGAGQKRPPPPLAVDGGDAGGGELGKGPVDGGGPGGAALGAQSDRELLSGEGTVVAERPEDAGGGRPQSGGGRVGELGQGAVVGAAEVVPLPLFQAGPFGMFRIGAIRTCWPSCLPMN